MAATITLSKVSTDGSTLRASLVGVIATHTDYTIALEAADGSLPDGDYRLALYDSSKTLLASTDQGYSTAITVTDGVGAGVLSTRTTQAQAAVASAERIQAVLVLWDGDGLYMPARMPVTLWRNESGEAAVSLDDAGHASSHTDGTDDIQDATASQKGLATAAQITKLDAIESGATADQTGAEIKVAYESEADTNAFTDADHTKLDGIEAGATADQSDAEIATAYGNEVAAASQAEMEAGTEAGIRRMSPLRVAEAIAELAPGGGGSGDMTAAVYDPTTVEGDAFDMGNMAEAADAKVLTAAERTKLSGIETAATADQTGAEIKAAYEAEADTNAFTDADHSKLDGIESGATADQSDAEILAAVESESGRDMSADGTKLDAIEASATADQTGAEIKAAYEAEADTNAFTDADHSKLDGIEAAADVTDAANVAAAGAPIITSGAGAPSSTPAAVGDIYVDTTGDNVWQAAGTASSADWKQSTGLGGGDLLAANNLSDVANAGTARTNLGLAIGSDVQAYSADIVETGDIDTLAELNAIISDATLIDTGDSRLSDSRAPTAHASNHTDGTDDIQDATAAQKGLATAAQITKLDGIESGATADQTGAEIKTAYEAEADTNAFTDADHTKLDGIATGATADTSKSIEIIAIERATDATTGSKADWYVPAELNGWELTAAKAWCQTAGTTGTMDVSVYNVTDAADMLSSDISIASAGTSASGTVDTANDDVATDDHIRIDVDAIHSGTAAKGLTVRLTFTQP